MAKLNDTSKGILGEASEKIGTYTEATGGGTPLKKGEKLKDHPEAKRVMQPRDEDGQFTYNSVNGKGLKYGPSRGTTIPPFLRGVKLTFCAPGTKLKIEGEDGIQVRLMTIDMTVQEIVEACKEYIESEEGFAGMGEGSSILKKGRKSKEEKEAEAGQIGYVDPKTLSQGTQNKMAQAKNMWAAKGSKVNPVPAQPKPKVQPQPQANPQPTPTQQPQQNPQINRTPVTPSGQQVQPKPTSTSIKGGLASIFSKKASTQTTQNDDNQDKFSNLNSSDFDGLFD